MSQEQALMIQTVILAVATIIATLIGAMLGHFFTLHSQRYARYFESRLNFLGLLAHLAEKHRYYAKVNEQSHGRYLFFQESAIHTFSENATLRDELDRSFWLCSVSLTKHKQKTTSKHWRDIRYLLDHGGDATKVMGQYQEQIKDYFDKIGPEIENLCSEFNIAIAES